MLKPSEIDDSMVTQRIMAALKNRAHSINRKGWIGRIADELNVSDDTVANWLHGDTCPTGGRLIALFALLGREFTDEIIELAGLGCARLENLEAVADANELARFKTMITQIEGVISDAKSNVVDFKGEAS